MKKVLLLASIFISLFANAQYNPANFTVSNKSYGTAQAVSTDARSWFYDGTNFVMRDYNGTSEVISYLNISKYRSGHFPIFVHSGGSLSSGVWTGGITLVYFFKDGTADINLVRWYTDSVIVTPKVDTMYRKNDSIIGFTINQGPERTILIRGTAAGGISSLSLSVPAALFGTPVTFANSGGAWTSSMILNNQNQNYIFAGPTTGGPGLPLFRQIVVNDLPTGILNANLANSSISFGTGTTGTDINWSTSSTALGGLATINVPNASISARGVISSSTFTIFSNKVDSTSIAASNDSVYDWHSGTKVFRYKIIGGGGSGITQLTGDGIAGPGSGSQVFTLNTVNPNVGSFGSASSVATFTVNGKGLHTAAGSVSIQIAESQVTNLTTDLSGKLITAANGLTDSAKTVLLGGIVYKDTKIDLSVSNSQLWIKTPFKGTGDTIRTGRNVMGDDTALAARWTNIHQGNAALLIDKTKSNNSENVDLFAMATSDGVGQNGFLFRNYTDLVGHTQPQMLTWSPSTTTISHGFTHLLFTKSGIPTNTAYVLSIKNYDSSKAANLGAPTKNIDLFVIENGRQHAFKIDSLYNIKIGNDANLAAAAKGNLELVDNSSAYGIVQLGASSKNVFNGPILLKTPATAATGDFLLLRNSTDSIVKQLGIGSGLSVSGGNLVVTSGGTGTVTSVSQSVPSSFLTISGSPITTSGTLALGLANAPANSWWGNNTGSSASPAYYTATQVTANLNLFSSSLQGLTPASGGGTTNFLRADGTWTTPPVGIGGRDSSLANLFVDTNYVPVIIITGESNASGESDNGCATGTELGARPLVQIMQSSGVFQDLNIGANNNMTTLTTVHGAELELANQATNTLRFHGKTVYLVKTGVPGLRISQIQPGQPNYDTITRRVDNALAILNSRGKTPVICIWHFQGVNDAINHQDPVQWRILTQNLFNLLRARYSAYGYMPIAAARIPVTTQTGTDADSLNKELDTMSIPRSNFMYSIQTPSGPVSSSCTDSVETGGIHWNYLGMKSIANKMMNTMSDTSGYLYLYNSISAARTGSWTTVGNRVVDSTNFMGTTSSNPLIFKTKSIQFMYVDTLQNILIGGTGKPVNPIGFGKDIFINAGVRVGNGPSNIISNIIIGGGSPMGNANASSSNNFTAGFGGLAACTSCKFNINIGDQGLAAITTVNSNVNIGFQGAYQNTGSNNFTGGTQVASWSTAFSNKLVLGDGSVTSIYSDKPAGWFILNNQGATIPVQTAGLGFDYRSTTLGFRLSYMTTTQWNASTKATGGHFMNSDTLGLQGFFDGTTTQYYATRSWALANITGGGATNIGSTQNALNYSLTSSTGTGTTLLTATTNLSGLLDTARTRYIDSLKNGLKTFTLNAINGLTASGGNNIGLGGTLSSTTNIATAGNDFSITGTTGSVTIAPRISFGGFATRTWTPGSLVTSTNTPFRVELGTLSDNTTASSGTIAETYASGIISPTQSAVNTSVTYSAAYSFYLSGAPTASTNVTITRAYALGVVGDAYFKNNLKIDGGVQTTGINNISSTYTITSLDYIVNCTSGTFTTTLPAISSANKGVTYIVKNSGAGIITIATTGGNTIDASSTITATTLVSRKLVSDGSSNWIVL